MTKPRRGIDSAGGDRDSLQLPCSALRSELTHRAFGVEELKNVTNQLKGKKESPVSFRVTGCYRGGMRSKAQPGTDVYTKEV